MQKDPYLILGLQKGVTKEEVESAYKSLRKKYSELKFEEGEIGANAAKMLGKLDQAYEDCLMDIKDSETVETYGNSYGEIESLIKNRNYEEAQTLLDNCEVRDAEWHYMEAQIFYRRQWHSEAKAQLEIACDLDPSNEKYKTTLERLEKVMNRGNNQQNANAEFNSRQQRAGYANPRNSQGDMDTSGACCDACSSLLCADCCCECMGGDLIPCC